MPLIHAGTVAALVHRLSGLALAIFLPVHVLALGLAFDAERFGAFIAWSRHPLVTLSETVLVAALALHLAGGLRLLAVELLHLPVLAARWVAATFAIGAGAGVLFLLGALGALG